MTPAQFPVLKAAILASLNPLVIAARSPVNDTELSRLYNLPSTPAFTAWKTLVTWDEIMENGMDFTRVDNLTNGSKWRIWEWLFKNSSNAINPSKPNHRAGIDAAWVGTAADLAVRASVYVHCKRIATEAEKVFATGTGTDVAPGQFAFEGAISAQDVSDAMRS